MEEKPNYSTTRTTRINLEISCLKLLKDFYEMPQKKFFFLVSDFD